MVKQNNQLWTTIVVSLIVAVISSLLTLTLVGSGPQFSPTDPWTDGGLFLFPTDGSGESVSIGHSGPALAKLDVRGDEARIWDGNALVDIASGAGDLYVEDMLEVDNDLFVGDDIFFNGELLPDGMACSNGQILQKNGTENWDCVALPGSGWVDNGLLVTLATSTDLVGIGTSTPLSKLDVRGDEVRIWDGSASVTIASEAGDLYVEDALEVDGNLTLSKLAGSGNDYACLNSAGKLYRSATAC